MPAACLSAMYLTEKKSCLIKVLKNINTCGQQR